MPRILLIGAIVVVTVLVFLPTIHYALVYDDFEQIVTNPRLTAWSYLPGYFTTHLWAHSPLQPPNYYRPIFLVWLRLVEVALGPPSTIWHLASILTHLGAMIAGLMLVYRMTGDFIHAALATALFAIHPIHTEPVAWISSAADPLLTIFLVLSVYFYIDRKGPISFLSLLFTTLAMFTKEAGIVAPALILAYEWTQSGFKKAIAGVVPYFLPALLYMAFRMNALGNLATGVPPNMSVGAMVLTWPRVLAVYAAHLAWPFHLSVCYDVPIETARWPLLLLIVAVAALTWAIRGSSANVRFGAAWFAITLVPSLGLRYLLTGDYVHDRYLYLPSFGLVLVFAVWLSRVRWTPAQVVIAGAITLAFCLGTRSNLRIWQNDVSLFQRAVETAPRNPYAKNNLADAYLKAHRESEAFPLLKEVIALSPGYRLGYYNMGRYYQQTGDYVEAEHYFSISDQMYYSQQLERSLR